MSDTPKSFEEWWDSQRESDDDLGTIRRISRNAWNTALSLTPQTAPDLDLLEGLATRREGDEGYLLPIRYRQPLLCLIAAARQDASPEKKEETAMSEQPVFTLLYRRTELMPDGGIGAVFIGEFGGDRSKDLRLTVAQAQTLADQITQKVGNHTIFEQGAPHAGK